jgi:hypothetical protein
MLPRNSATTLGRSLHRAGGQTTVKIEFLESGSDDCPLIRIYGDQPAVCGITQRTLRAKLQDVGLHMAHSPS